MSDTLTTNERIAELHQRVRRERSKREKRILASLSTTCVVLCAWILCLAKVYSGTKQHSVKVADLSGSTLLFENAGSYVLVGVTSFTAAVIITLICLKHKEKINKQAINQKEGNKQ